jgi:hypothetical protein
MNEVSRCCRVLNVRHGATFEEVKAAYRDLVQVWHPDRFAGNVRLQDSAQDKLKEINLAWEYLSVNAFCDGVLVEPEDKAAEPAAGAGAPDLSSKTEFGSRRATWPWLLTAAFLVVAGAFVLVWRQPHAPVQRQAPMVATNEAPASAVAIPLISESNGPASPPPPQAVPVVRLFPFATDVLAGHARTNINGWLEFPPLLQPPFSVRLEAAVSDLTDFRLHYAIGQVIFNWSDHPKDLLIELPQNAVFTTVPGKGLLLPGTPQEIVWIVDSNRMAVQVDGKMRFQTNDNFAGLKGCVSVGPFSDAVKLTTFEIQTPEVPSRSRTASSKHTPSADNVLSSMIPEKNLTERSSPEGVTIQSAVDSAYRLMTSQSFRPPFTVRTRAKTDAYNLRLFCEKGMIIFNWELNNRELRVHDPLNGTCTPVANQGFILPNEWHTISWSIQPMGMTLTVDGKARFQNHRDYRAVDSKVGIGPFRSELTIDYFVVEKK